MSSTLVTTLSSATLGNQQHTPLQLGKARQYHRCNQRSIGVGAAWHLERWAFLRPRTAAQGHGIRGGGTTPECPVVFFPLNVVYICSLLISHDLLDTGGIAVDPGERLIKILGPAQHTGYSQEPSLCGSS